MPLPHSLSCRSSGPQGTSLGFSWSQAKATIQWAAPCHIQWHNRAGSFLCSQVPGWISPSLPEHQWHGSGHAVDVDFISIQALGLQENLVLMFIRELDDFVFNRGAITRAQALDLPRVKRRTMQIVAEDLVSFGIRITDPAHGLRLTDGPGSEAERCGNRIARLHLKPGEVNGARIKTRGGSRLEPSHFKSMPSQGLTQHHCRRLAGTAGRISLLATMNEAVQKGSGGDDHRARLHGATIPQADTPNAAFRHAIRERPRKFFQNKVHNLCLLDA